MFIISINNFGVMKLGSTEPLDINFKDMDILVIESILSLRVIEQNTTDS